MNRNPSMAGLASLVQSRGRNGDSVLVHMAPEEVKGLQSLALAHGGSLTLNPETGLYEASFLKKLLPTIIGLALAPLTAGTSLAFLGNPLVAGALVGGVEGLRTGDLGKGLMAGLGAFGGASLGAGLSAAAGTAGAGASSTGALTAEQIAQKAITDAGTFGYSNAVPAAQTAINTAATSASAAPTGFFNQMGQGVRALATPTGRTAFMNAVPGGMTGIAAGGMGIANAMTPEFKPMSPEEEEQYYYQSYGYDPSQGRFLGGQFQRGYPGYPSGYAMGGQVSPAPNYSYPQANITKSNYAPSLEYAKPREILDGYDTKIDPFTGAETFADGGAVGVAPEQNIQAQLGPQSLEQYYQSLLSAPQASAANPAFANYLQGLNQFVTSPIAPPPPPAAAPPGTPTTPGGGTTPTPGGGQRWDATLGRFVPGTGSAGDSYADLSGLAGLVNSGMFSGMNFGDLGNYLQNGGYGDTSGLTYNPTSGTFGQAAASPAAATAGAPTSNITAGGIAAKSFRGEPLTAEEQAFADAMDQQPQQINYSYDPMAARNAMMPQFASISPMTDLPTVEQAMERDRIEASGLTAAQDFFGVRGEGSPVAPLQTDFGPPQAAQQGNLTDMGAYGQQFQGFQPMQTDFGSTYQAPAMMTPSLDMMAYSQQPLDLGSMGNYGLGALGTTYSAPTFQMPSMDYGMQQTPAVPTTSFSTPMTTGMPSTGATAPQYGFGNSDVMYGRSAFGGNEPNIFGFAEGGSVQRAAAGKLITGDGDGMSDDIRANIDGNQEARLADGEFVIPADVVSHLGNGSTDAGADQLHAMMDRIRKARTGRSKQAPEIDPGEYLPA